MEQRPIEVTEILKLIHKAAKEVHRHLKGRFHESVYRNALLIELENFGLTTEAEVPVNVHYKNQLVGRFRVDILVNKQVIIELKAISETTTVHDIQLVNYLQATGIDHGVLINFGGNSLFIRNKTRIYQPDH